ncbi:hypothetical protein [Ligilactobacillus animalis]|uniref:hypothetical protein n=1 Tax=Ligilactobacillus animalis TaxID=1605 RepID=UPI00384F5FE4
MKNKQPFYRNKVAMLLRLCSYANTLAWLIVFFRALYLYLALGWSLGFKATVYMIFAPFLIAVFEVLHGEAVKYGNQLFTKKMTD